MARMCKEISLSAFGIIALATALTTALAVVGAAPVSMKCTSNPALALTTDRLISACISTCRPSAKQVPRISMRVSELPTGLFQEAFDIRLVTKLCMRD